MIDSYIFTGIHFVTGQYKISNSEIQKAIESGILEGFDKNRIKESEEFKSQSALNEFEYLCKTLMGFEFRYHVVPFPPDFNHMEEAEDVISLCVKATEQALEKAGLKGDDIDAWFASTATQAHITPGIAEFIKSYFTGIHNRKPTYSITSACVGFNINLENAINYFKNHPEAQHILIAHGEVMSSLLKKERDFVPYVTFGDSAAAVVVSRVKTKKQCGVIAITNHEDTTMIDFLASDSKGNLIMNPRMVKNRAVPNITKAFQIIEEKSQIGFTDVDIFIPHQTGNTIVDSVIKNLNLDQNKVFKDIQLKYGNLSGASVPASICELENQEKLLPGMKVFTAVAGLGGEFGGFSYIVPEEKVKFDSKKELEGKTILITGASGGLGKEIAICAAENSCSNILLQYNSGTQEALKIKEKIESEFGQSCRIYKADLSNEIEIKNFKSNVINDHKSIDYLICTHAITGSLAKAGEISIEEYKKVMEVNYRSVKNTVEIFADAVKECVLITGSVGEDAQFPGSAPYVASKRALRAFAREFANNLYQRNVRCIYYLPGVIDSGMISILNEQQISTSLQAIRQKKLTPVREIASRILHSTYRLNVPDVRRSMESKLIVIKDSYHNY